MTGLCAVMAAGIAAAAVTAHASEEDARLAALQALSDRLAAEREEVYVYSDFGMTKNHFTQKAKMAGINADLVMDMDENWREYPASGSSCIRCEQLTREGDWGGWLFLNGYLPHGESIARLNDGTIDGQGLNLGGAQELRFFARGTALEQAIITLCIEKALLIETAPLKAMIHIGRQDKIIFILYQCKQSPVEI